MFKPPFTWALSSAPDDLRKTFAIMDAEGFTVAESVEASARDLFLAAPTILAALRTAVLPENPNETMPGSVSEQLASIANQTYGIDDDFTPVVSFEDEVDALMNKAIDAAVSVVQQACDQIDGGLAGDFFRDSCNTEAIRDYVILELIAQRERNA